MSRVPGRWARHPAVYEQPFLPCLAVGSLGNADELERTEAERLEFAMHFVDLAQATVDEQHIRRHDFARLTRS